ncbi:glycosyltransferase family 4 protein [Rhodovulum adriaticum]|uniref:Glycosyltransferase involved in cell wall biosynthesis n=1 Tax=Rhodovulum adriaticum TaxID=35804 RepID=A0A4R2P081_RHOAD|nr:glycosyltransferase family 4 protein [Rhodovulum adriaticum]TCP27231.1 glycosyltransferase involved in cell wall biosynthesis [Rhodovulum adriaticum]
MAGLAQDRSAPRILAVSHESLLYGAPRSLTMICAYMQGRARMRMLTFGAGDLVGFARGQGLDLRILNACDRIPDPTRPRLAYRIQQNWLRLQRRICAMAVFLGLLAEVRRADLVYVNTVLRAAPVWAARLMRRPVVLHVREAENYLCPRGAWQRWRLRSVLGSASRVICVSEAVRQLVLDVPGTGLTPAHVHTVYNGIDAGDFAPDSGARADFRAAHGIPADAPVACFVGNMRPRKGLDLFLRAATALRAEFPQAHFVVAGGTEDDVAAFRRDHVPADLAPAVHFLGFVQDVRPVLWGADVFAMLSRCEPFARVNLEASAAGCAVVATAVDGNVEIFEDEANALVIPPDDLSATVTALRRLLSDAKLRARLAGQARAVVTDRFTLAACHDRVAEILIGEARG